MEKKSYYQYSDLVWHLNCSFKFTPLKADVHPNYIQNFGSYLKEVKLHINYKDQLVNVV